MVINPKAAKSFAQALMMRGKTDPLDAEMLAQFVDQMKFKAWIPPRRQVLDIRACSHRLASLTKSKAKAKNQLHAIHGMLRSGKTFDGTHFYSIPAAK